MEVLQKVNKLLDVLKIAKRIGYRTDDPEGVRYIQLSDTLVNMMINSLEEIKNELKTEDKISTEDIINYIW